MLRAGASAETSWSRGLAGWLRALLADFGADIAEGLLIAEFGQNIAQLVSSGNKLMRILFCLIQSRSAAKRIAIACFDSSSFR